MKKTAIFFLAVFVCAFQSCKKETSQAGPVENNAQVNFDLEGESMEVVYKENEPNEYIPYSFGGVAGHYFGLTTSFTLGNKTTVLITLGTELSSSEILTDSSLLELIEPGEKVYGSLGAFSSYPQLQAGMVEIAVTDKESKRWCSTRITEQLTDFGIDAKVEVTQPGSEFRIEETQKLDAATPNERYRIRGRFDCLLYEVNGPSKKKLKGKFVGLVYRKG